MTDLMCHPQDYQEWARALAVSLRTAASSSPDATVLPHIPTCAPALMSASGACCKGAGHSGIMRLAATLVRELFVRHRLARLLTGDVDAPSERAQSRRNSWLPSPNRCACACRACSAVTKCGSAC